ncbi:hypothetical protein BJY24_000083 [Nocardia transvalensis]|uniref:DUF7144 domain-containing protein n=1 Tax=Nocardia transvalensis TaxID=37333 RepID=A0A7W9P820_9NOCA|nr:hypothetical protein [Nocardia transvalensis]MBB5911216.1 hypothetical protein [Nocardia transvalensis]
MTPSPDDHPMRQGLAAGTSIVAGILLLTGGLLSLFQGISAVADDDLFVAGADYVYRFDVTAWGWIHIVLGVLLALSAGGLIAGTAWGRIVAIIVAALSIMGNFLWLPYYPGWSMLVIALDVVIIWAVATWRPQT